MALPAAASAASFDSTSTSEPTTRKHFWQKNLDDAILTESPVSDTDADILRTVVADEEQLLQEEEDNNAETTAEGYQEELIETAKLLLSGGVAGAFSKSCTAPLARLTILQQVEGLRSLHNLSLRTATTTTATSTTTRLGVAAALNHIIQQEGVKALWKGNGVTIIHRLPYSAANFWVYENVNEWWKGHIPAKGPLALGDVSRRLFAGGLAGMAACSLAYPLDLIRTRLAAQTTSVYYTGINHAMATIVRDEGFRGLYRGLGATLLQVAPSLAINYAAYETARSFWLTHTDLATPTVGMSLACGSFAGLVSSSATFPLDLVRRRMQVQGQGGGARVYGSYGNAFKTIIAREGVRGLYAGILPEYYKVVPGVAIAFCTYELMKASLGVRTNSASR